MMITSVAQPKFGAIFSTASCAEDKVELGFVPVNDTEAQILSRVLNHEIKPSSPNAKLESSDIVTLKSNINVPNPRDVFQLTFKDKPPISITPTFLYGLLDILTQKRSFMSVQSKNVDIQSGILVLIKHLEKITREPKLTIPLKINELAQLGLLQILSPGLSTTDSRSTVMDRFFPGEHRRLIDMNFRKLNMHDLKYLIALLQNGVNKGTIKLTPTSVS